VPELVHLRSGSVAILLRMAGCLASRDRMCRDYVEFRGNCLDRRPLLPPRALLALSADTAQRALRLLSRPVDNARSVEIVAPHCDGCLEVRQIAERGPWLLVETTGEGVAVTGWIPRSRLKKKTTGNGRGYGCTGDHPRGLGGEHRVRGPHYQGPARVRARTRVFSDPPQGEWAVIRTDLSVEVRHIDGEQWVELRNVPGLHSSPSGLPRLFAYVPVQAVSFPSPKKRH
jgi:hypothetical protein